MTTSPRNFDDVARLPRADIETLLVSSEPFERVYAAWALASMLGEQPDFSARIATEPNPGVRRHLAVLLASTGRLDALDVLTAHDPDEHVRAHAIRLRYQCTPSEAKAAFADTMVSIAVADPEVRETVLLQLEGAFPKGRHAALETMIAEGSERVRMLAFEHGIAALDGERRVSLCHAALDAEVYVSASTAMRDRIVATFANDELTALLIRTDTQHLEAFARDIERAARTIPFDGVVRAIADDETREYALRHVLLERSEVPLSWLARRTRALTIEMDETETYERTWLRRAYTGALISRADAITAPDEIARPDLEAMLAECERRLRAYLPATSMVFEAETEALYRRRASDAEEAANTLKGHDAYDDTRAAADALRATADLIAMHRRLGA